MRRIFNIITAAMSVFAVMSCTGNYEYINGDPYAVGEEEMQRDGYIIRASLTSIANGVMSPDVNTTQFTEALNAGPLCGHFAQANVGFTKTTGNFNPPDDWTNVFMSSEHIIPVIYPNLKKLKKVTDDEVILSVAEIIKIAAMHRITDAHGPIPYSKIGENGDLKVPYDSQETVYRTMFGELDAAIQTLSRNRTNNFSPSADIIYDGNVDNWIKFANSLKLRLAMRVSVAAPELAREMAAEAINHEVGTFTSNSDNALFASFGPDGNPLNVAVEYNKVDKHDDGSLCTTESGDTHAAADIICYMNGYNDPRREKYFTKCEWKTSETGGYEYCGLRHGIVIPDHKTTGHKYSGVRIGVDDPMIWMNAAEVAFLKAEYELRWGTASEAGRFYEEGIRLSFDQWGVGGVESYLLDAASKVTVYVDPAGNNTYENPVSNITICWDDAATFDKNLERIMTQKWIANWRVPNEAWSDWRRTGYPAILPPTENGNMSNGIVNSAKGGRRLPYPASEAVSNSENYKQAITLLGGEDNMATELWFCKKQSDNQNAN